MPSLPEIQRQADEAARFVRDRARLRPRLGLVLGSGLASVAGAVADATRIPFREIPHLPTTGAIGHRGELLLGHFSGMPTAVLSGRLHAYEGHSLDLVALPTRILARLGVERLILTNAAGGLNPRFGQGEIVLITDHLNWLFRQPRRAARADGLELPAREGPIYDIALGRLLRAAARATDIELREGVYAAMLGPSYETRAEYRMLHRLGADLVGMSTFAEALAAQQEGLSIAGLSLVSNVCQPDRLGEVSGELVVQNVSRAASAVRRLLLEFSSRLGPA